MAQPRTLQNALPGDFSNSYSLGCTSILPWDLRAWSKDLRVAGFAGWALLCLEIAAFGLVRDSNDQTMHENALSLVFFRAPFTFMALLLLFASPTFKRVGLKSYLGGFVVYCSYFLASAFWSFIPTNTLGKALELAIGIGIVLHSMAKPNAIQQLEALQSLLLRAISTIGSLAVIGYLLRIPEFVSRHAGLFTNSTAEAPFLSGNGVGYVSSALILSVLASWYSDQIPRRKAIPQLCYAGFIFMFAASRTSMAILALGFSIVLVRKSRTLAISYAFLSTIGIYLLRGKILAFLQGSQISGNFDTLSGRTVMWAAALQDWKQHPILGYGGGVGGKYVISHLGISGLGTQFSSIHSGVLELLTGLGAVGFCIGAGLLVAVTAGSIRHWKSRTQSIAPYILVPHMLITTVMSAGVLAWMSYELLFFIILMGRLDIENQQRRQLQARMRIQYAMYAAQPAASLAEAGTSS
jgi:O-antigen ligase